MKVVVRFFAAARERAGCASAELELSPGTTVGALRVELVGRFPKLEPVLARLRFAVDQEFADEQQVLHDESEVALIPPVAGGSPLYRVQEAPLSLDEVVRAVSATRQGGLVTFTGVVRDHSKGKRVLKLEYEAYVPMAEQKLAQIGFEASKEWPGVDVAVVHRVGVLLPGDEAVVIAVSAPHRKEAFRACEFVIDRLKECVPIWKKEFTDDGEVWVGLGP